MSGDETILALERELMRRGKTLREWALEVLGDDVLVMAVERVLGAAPAREAFAEVVLRGHTRYGEPGWFVASPYTARVSYPAPSFWERETRDDRGESSPGGDSPERGEGAPLEAPELSWPTWK